MKHSLIAILFIALAVPCSAQWKATGTNIEIVAIAPHDSSLFLSSPGHIIRFNPLSGDADAGINFSDGNITSFASLGGYFFANIGTGYSFRSSNNGSAWQQRPGGKVITTCGSYLFARYQYFLDGPYMSVSRDSGNTWDSLANFDPQSFAINGICIYANTGSALMRSRDTGSIGSWQQLLSPPFLGTMLTMDSLLFMYQNYRSGGNGELIVSRDSGITWDTVAVDSAGAPEYVTCLATDGKNLFAGGVSGVLDPVYHVHFGNGFYVSTDVGKSWYPKNDVLGTPNQNPMNVEAIGFYPYDTSIYISLNNNNFGSSSDIVYATYYRPIKELIDTAPEGVVQALATADSIEIYPNPSLGTFTISGSEPILSVEVTSILGTNILTLPEVNQRSVSFDVSKEPPGTYFVEIRTSKGIALKKVTIER